MRVKEWGFRVKRNDRCTEKEWDEGIKSGKSLIAVRRGQRYSTGDELTKVYRRTRKGTLRRIPLRKLETMTDEQLRKHYHWLDSGLIKRVFEVSAQFCEELASRAFESEAALNAPADSAEQKALISAQRLKGGLNRDEVSARRRAAFMAPHIAPSPRKPTRNALAGQARIAQSSLSRWYNGLIRLSDEKLGLLAEYLEVPPDTIPN